MTTAMGTRGCHATARIASQAVRGCCVAGPGPSRCASSAASVSLPSYSLARRRAAASPQTACTIDFCRHVRNFTSSSRRQKQASIVDDSPIPIFSTVADFREWRNKATAAGRSVGFVPTMGALHQGHLSLVEESLRENDETVVSIFVNPAQFAPTEDLSSYPRTLPTDIAALASLAKSTNLPPVSAIFAPTVPEMYPSPDGRPFTQHVAEQVGAFVEVQGLQHKMEGASRPTFFRGVATVVTKLFHVVQPHRAYFGQKDIQQAIVLRRMVSDLLFAHPPSAEAVRVLTTARDPSDGLALSSRNAYLTARARPHANILYRALRAGQHTWEHTHGSVQDTLHAARQAAQVVVEEARRDNISLEVLYIDLNDPISLDNLEERQQSGASRGAILSGAALIRDGPDGKVTRLIDNFLLGFSL